LCHYLVTSDKHDEMGAKEINYLLTKCY